MLVIAPQAIQFRRGALETRLRMLDAILDETDVVRQRGARAGIRLQAFVDDHARQHRAHEAGKIALNAFAQLAQGAAATLVVTHAEVSQCLIHFEVGRLFAEDARQSLFEFLRRRSGGDRPIGKREGGTTTGGGGFLFLIAWPREQ